MPKKPCKKRKKEKPKAKKRAVKAAEDSLKKAVGREARKALPLTEFELSDLYSVLGAQVQAAQGISKLAAAKPPRGVDKKSFFIQGLSLTAETPCKTGESFLGKYWAKVLSRACRWWEENKEKYSGKTLVANLALALAPAFPKAWRDAAAVLVTVAAILVRAGLDELCEERPERPPGTEVKEEVEEAVEEEVVEEKPAEEVSEATEVSEEAPSGEPGEAQPSW